MHLVETPIATFNSQFPDSRLIGLTRGASYTNERSLFLAERLDMVRTLQTGSDFSHNDCLTVHVMHGDIGDD